MVWFDVLAATLKCVKGPSRASLDHRSDRGPSRIRPGQFRFPPSQPSSAYQKLVRSCSCGVRLSPRQRLHLRIPHLTTRTRTVTSDNIVLVSCPESADHPGSDKLLLAFFNDSLATLPLFSPRRDESPRCRAAGPTPIPHSKIVTNQTCASLRPSSSRPTSTRPRSLLLLFVSSLLAFPSPGKPSITTPTSSQATQISVVSYGPRSGVHFCRQVRRSVASSAFQSCPIHFALTRAPFCCFLRH